MPNNNTHPNLSPEKSPHDKFLELGERLLAVPRTEVERKEAEWQQRRAKTARKKKR